MASTSLNMYFQGLRRRTDVQQSEFAGKVRRQIQIMLAVFAAAVMVFSPEAFAQTTTGLCDFAVFLKNLATGGAIVAVILFVLNSFFIKSSVVGDIIMYVIIGCVIVAVAPDIIDLTGLTTQCSY